MSKQRAGWRVSTIGSECQVFSGSTPKTNVSKYWGGDIPWITPNDLSKNPAKFLDGGERFITEAGYESCSTRTVPKGSVLYSSRAPIGYVAIANREMCTNQGFKTAIPSGSLDSEFLYYYLQHLTPEIKSRASGTTFIEISGKKFADVPILVPPIAEQHHIVEILEGHLSRLDAARADIEQVRVKTIQFRKSLINQCSAGWIDDVSLQGKYDDTGRPQLAQGWKWKTIDEIIGGVKQNAAIGPFGSNLKVSDYREKGVPLVFVRNIRAKIFDPIGQPCIDVEKASCLAVHDVKIGDVLVTKMGDPPGDCAVYSLRSPGIITSDCLRLRPSRDFDANYIAMVISSSFVQQQIARISQGVAQQKMSLGRFRKHVEIPCPDLTTQIRILKHLDPILESLRVDFSDAKSLEEYASNLRRSLLQAAFTGQLTREANHV